MFIKLGVTLFSLLKSVALDVAIVIGLAVLLLDENKAAIDIFKVVCILLDNVGCFPVIDSIGTLLFILDFIPVASEDSQVLLVVKLDTSETLGLEGWWQDDQCLLIRLVHIFFY